MNNIPAISVIIPIYKVEIFLNDCVDSILTQTFIDFELILINDGSPDRCGEICNEYAQIDKRVKVIHQKNGGVSIARQAGLDFAKGEYVIHADPDDWVDATMLEELFSKAKEGDVDMVICDFWIEDNIGCHYCSQNPGNDLRAEILQKKILLQQLHGSCCNKLIKRTCYNGIAFSPQHLCILEDELFNIRILSRDIKVTYLPKSYYHYRTNNNNSLCHSLSDKSFYSKIDAISEIEKFLSEECPNIAKGDFYAIKKNVLFDAMRTKRFTKLQSMYPEIHHRAIEDGRCYRWYTPQTYCISIALRGNPILAYYIYILNIWLINICKRIKKWIK